MTRRLVVSVHDLRSTDVQALKVFLRFVGQSADFAWELSDQHDGDLRLVAWDEQTWPDRLDDPQAAPVVPVVDDARHTPWHDGLCLQRPLQMEAFADLLRMREARLASASSDATRSQPVGSAFTPAPRSPGDPAAPQGSGPVDRPAALGAVAVQRPGQAARPPAPVMPPGQAAGEALPIPPAFVGVRFRLLRWPSAGQMRGRPSLTRVLGFLAHRPMSLEQLVLHSGLAVGQCSELLLFLENGQLVQRLGAPPADDPSPLRPVPTAAPAPQAATDGLAGPSAIGSPQARPAVPTRIAGLLSRLRLHLGI